jgi:hypothetical protein
LRQVVERLDVATLVRQDAPNHSESGQRRGQDSFYLPWRRIPHFAAAADRENLQTSPAPVSDAKKDRSTAAFNLRSFVIAIVVATGLLAVAADLASAQQTKPNIVIIRGDDTGQSNVSAYSMGLMGYRTPNIDGIAKAGMIFTSSRDSRCLETPVAAPGGGHGSGSLRITSANPQPSR